MANQLDQQQTAATGSDAQAGLAALAERLDRMEQRLVEQEATVKHTLAMLIEWLEADQQAAA